MKHSETRNWIHNWIADVEKMEWKTPVDIKRFYSSASVLSENRVIFNVKGNKYRMETQVAFHVKVVAIKWIGIHQEYTKRFG